MGQSFAGVLSTSPVNRSPGVAGSVQVQVRLSTAFTWKPGLIFWKTISPVAMSVIVSDCSTPTSVVPVICPTALVTTTTSCFTGRAGEHGHHKLQGDQQHDEALHRTSPVADALINRR